MAKWVQGSMKVNSIMEIHEDQLDMIGPSIGSSVITPAIYEMVDALEMRSLLEVQEVKAMWQIIQREYAIVDLYEERIGWMKQAKELVEEEENNKQAGLPQGVQKVLPKEILLAIYDIDIKIMNHRLEADTLEHTYFPE